MNRNFNILIAVFYIIVSVSQIMCFTPITECQFYDSLIQSKICNRTSNQQDFNTVGDTRSFHNQYLHLPRQSPINLKILNSLTVVLPPLKLNFYDTEISSMRLINNGATVMLSLPKNYPTDQTPYVSGSAFFANYRFVQLHFHWGKNSIDGGSEHLLRSKRYAAEMHLVHYNTKYSSFAAATSYTDGVAVVAVLLDTTNNPNDNTGLEKIISKLSSITSSGSETILSSPLKLNELLPFNKKLFYRYHGSLTTPNYNEIVTWTVFKKPLYVSERQVAALRTIHDDNGNEINENYRDVQANNGRLILFNWRPSLWPFFN